MVNMGVLRVSTFPDSPRGELLTGFAAAQPAGFFPHQRTKTLRVVVKPNSRNNEIIGYSDEKKAWLISIKVAAEKNEANRELLKFIKKETGRRWMVKSGAHNREKTLIATSSYFPSSQRTPQGR